MQTYSALSLKSLTEEPKADCQLLNKHTFLTKNTTSTCVLQTYFMDVFLNSSFFYLLQKYVDG